MSSDPCRPYREAIGSYVLGHLDERERTRLEEHLETCPDCRAEVEELKPVARSLEKVRLQPEPIRPPANLEERVLGGVSRAARRERSRRNALILGAAATLVAVLITGMLLTREEPARRVDLAAAQGVEASAEMGARSWGTAIDLRVAGLAGNEVFAVWLEDAAGERTSAGTFRSVEGKELSVSLASSLPLSDATVLGISDQRGQTVMQARL